MKHTENILIIIQARMSSSRLPGKVILPLLDGTVLEKMVQRVLKSKYAATLVIATSTDVTDIPIVQEAKRLQIACFRGSMHNLLKRHYEAAVLHQADLILKIPSDCPLIDPRIIDSVLDYYFQHKNDFDYVSNLHPATFPDGNDVEIMTMACLQKAFKEARLPMELEHTTPYIWEHPELFRIGNMTWSTGLDLSMSHRFTLDYTEDYELIKEVFKRLYPANPDFSCNEILQLLEAFPDLYKINACYAGVNWYRHHLSELKTISPQQTRTLLSDPLAI